MVSHPGLSKESASSRHETNKGFPVDLVDLSSMRAWGDPSARDPAICDAMPESVGSVEISTMGTLTNKHGLTFGLGRCSEANQLNLMLFPWYDCTVNGVIIHCS